MDPFFVAEAIGSSVPLAILFFFVTRKMVGPSGSGVLEKLKEQAGMEREEGRAASLFRDWAPYFMAVVGGVFGLGLALRNGSPFAKDSTRFTAEEIPALKVAYVEACTKKCTSEGTEYARCPPLCGCSFGVLEAKHPSKRALADWFTTALRDKERMEAEFDAARAQCSAVQEPDPSVPMPEY